MSTPSRTAPTQPEPTFDPLQELIQVVSGDGQEAPSRRGREQPAEPNGSQAGDSFTSEVVAALKEVVAVLDGPEMAAFCALLHAGGGVYNGPRINMERLRSLIVKAEERSHLPKRAA